MIKSQQGFTLIELMITIAILVIITSIAVPNFSDLIKKYKFNNEAKAVLNLIKESRIQAMTFKRDVKLTFSKSSSDTNSISNLYWNSKNAQILTTTNIEFDMFGKLKVRPVNGCLAISHKSDSSLKKIIVINVLGGVDKIQEGVTCS